MDFSQVEAEFKRLRARFETGALTEGEFKTQLEELMIQDEKGQWWMIGYETGQWYYHDGEKWVQSEPPKPAPFTPPTAGVSLRRVHKLFQEEHSWLYFLSIVIAGGVWWFVSHVLDIFFFYGPFNALFAVVAAFLIGLVLRTRVRRRWQAVLALAASWVAAGRITIVLDAITWGELGYLLMLLIEMAIIFALGISFSALFVKIFGSREFIAP